MRALIVLALAATLAGCADAVEQIRGAPPPREPYVAEHRATLGPEHAASYPVPVEARALLVNVTLEMLTRSQGLLRDAPSPAQGRLDLVAPDGAILASADIDPRLGKVALDIVGPDPGPYEARVTGVGAAQKVQDSDLGAAYVLRVEVTYR